MVNQSTTRETTYDVNAIRTPTKEIDSPQTVVTGKANKTEEAKPAKRKSAKWVLSLAFIIGLLAGAILEAQHQRKAPVIMAVNGATVDQQMLFEAMQNGYGAATMQQLINDELQLQYASSLGVAPTDQQVDEYVARAQAVPGFDEKLLESDQTFSNFKWRARVRMAQAAVMGKGVTITDADVHKYYGEQTDPNNTNAAYYVPATTTVSVVVTSSKANADEAYRELTIGTPFDVVAREYSQDSSASIGGTIPTIIYGRSRLAQIPGMQDALFSLRIGELMPPRFFAGGWWVVRCLSRSPKEIQPFEDVEDDCRLGALYEKGEALHGQDVNEDYAQFQHAANVQGFWPQYKSLAQ